MLEIQLLYQDIGPEHTLFSYMLGKSPHNDKLNEKLTVMTIIMLQWYSQDLSPSH